MIQVTEKQRSNEEQDKRLAVEAAYSTLTTAEFAAWQACRYTFRSSAHYDKIFVIWKYVRNQARVEGFIRMLEPSICAETGISIQIGLEIGEATYEMSLTHAPMPIFENKVFCHIPFIITAFYTPDLRTKRMVLRLPLVFKTEAKPWDLDGGIRVTQLSDFRNEHPAYKDLQP